MSPPRIEKVPTLRATKGGVVVTRAKLDLLRKVHRGEWIGVRSSWVTRLLVADGLLCERSHDFAPLAPITGLSITGLSALTMRGLLAVERGRVGILAA